MQVCGLSEGSQKQYLSAVNVFFRETWLGADSVTERDVQEFLVSLRGRDVARETFRGYRHALQFLFCQTLGCDWPLFKKKLSRRPKNGCRRCWSMNSV